MNAVTKIRIPMDNGCAIVAETSADPAFYGEIYLGVEDPHGAWLQDLAIVRGAYRYDDQLQRAVYDGEKYDVIVYGDPMSEDFTDVFEIDKYTRRKAEYGLHRMLSR